MYVKHHINNKAYDRGAVGVVPPHAPDQAPLIALKEVKGRNGRKGRNEPNEGELREREESACKG